MWLKIVILGMTLALAHSDHDCSFEEHPNTRVVGASQTAFRLEDCFDYCRGIACAAIDYNNRTDICWVHESPTDFSNAIGAEHVTQYRYMCPGTGGGGVATTAVQTEAPTPTPAPRDCVFEDKEGYQLLGGDLVPGVSSVPDCKEYCYDNQACIGVDYAKLVNECYSHSTGADFDNSQPNSDVDQYRLVCRGCTFEKYEGFQVLFGTKTTAGTMDDCVAACPTEDGCNGVDFNIQFNECWLHYNADFSNPLENANVIQYRWECTDDEEATTAGGTPPPSTPAATTPGCIYTEHLDTQLIGGVSNSANTVATCLTECLNRANCDGFDFNTQQNTCWLLIDVDDFSGSVSNSNVDQYRLC